MCLLFKESISMAHHHLFQLSKLHAKSTKLYVKSPCLWALVWPCNPRVHPQFECFLSRIVINWANLRTPFMKVGIGSEDRFAGSYFDKAWFNQEYEQLDFKAHVRQMQNWGCKILCEDQCFSLKNFYLF
jgi:hypothetical protein